MESNKIKTNLTMQNEWIKRSTKTLTERLEYLKTKNAETHNNYLAAEISALGLALKLFGEEHVRVRAQISRIRDRELLNGVDTISRTVVS